MKLSAKTGVALAITALSLAFTVGAGASDTVEPVDAWVMHCCTAYSEAGPATSSVTTGASTTDTVEPANTRLISCCTAYSEAGPATSSVTTGASTTGTVEPANTRLISCCTAYSEAGPATSSVTTGASTTGTVEPVDAWVMHCCTAYSEDVSVTPLPTFLVTPLATSAAHVGMMNQLRNLTEPNAIAWGWSQGLANDQASAGVTQYGGSTARVLSR